MWLIWSVFLLDFFGHIFAVKHEAMRDQLCIDPRTGKKHEAYSEWSDAYSCSRHRCQPSGKTMSIFSVGCKKVEAPDTAIECEQVVEDTNMQFPYCCTRLRCLVVVRGEIWTKVLGQPWEALPAAPWSHMYKIKKPAPEASNEPSKNQVIHPKSPGPVYQLDSQDSVNGASKKKSLRQRVRRRRSTTYSPHAHTHEAEFDRADDYQSYKDQSDGKETKFRGSSETKTQSEDEEFQTMSPEFYEKLQDLKSISDQNQGAKSVENILLDAAEKIAKEQKEAEAGFKKTMRSKVKSLETAVENTRSDYRSNEENVQESSSDSPLDQENDKEERKLVADDRRPLLDEREGNDDTKTVQKRKKHRSKKLRKRRIQREKNRRKKSNAEVDFRKSEKND